jgi:outer membrane lipoprotein-sorting protein
MNANHEHFERQIAAASVDDSIRAAHRDELRKRVLAAYDQSQSTRRPRFTTVRLQNFGRWIMARPVSRVGFPVAALVLLAVALATMWPAKRGFAFEDLVRPLVEAKTARCTIVVKIKDMPAHTITAYFRGKVHRQESKAMGTVNIFDEESGTMLTLIEGQHVAQVLQSVNRDPKQAASQGFLQSIRDQLIGMKDDKQIVRRSLGEQVIAGLKMVGYRVTSPAMDMKIWGDRETGLPYAIETRMAAFPTAELTFTDFEFDMPLDAALFSLTPPAGYTVRRDTIDVSQPTEDDLVAALREFAKANDGAYPDELSMTEAIKLSTKMRVLLMRESTEKADQEMNRLIKLLGRSFNFPLVQGRDADTAYAGRGVKSNAGETPIFWYKPAGGDVYRVIRADLTVVEADNAPEAKDAQRFAPVTDPTAERN